MDFVTTSVEELLAQSRASEGEMVVGAVDCTRDRVQLGRLSITHEAVMDWLLVNPGKGQMKLCAEYFGFSRAWLSSMLHSDAFQAKLRDKQEMAYVENIIPIRDQINGVAQLALEKLGEKIEDTEDGKFLLDTADKMLHKLGYAPKVDHNPSAGNTNNTQNNFYGVNPELLAQARENSKKGTLLNGDTTSALPAPEGIQDNETSDVGEIAEGSSDIRDEEEKGA